MKKRIAVAVIGAAFALAPLSAGAAGEDADRNQSFTLEYRYLWKIAEPVSVIGMVFEYQRAISNQVALHGGLQFRNVGQFLGGGEQMNALELAAGGRYFPVGRAPFGFYVGGQAAAGRGDWVKIEGHSIFSGDPGEVVDQGAGPAFSVLGQAGWLWNPTGGFAIGVHADLDLGTLTSRNHSVAAFAGAGFSIGGAW